MMSKKIAMVLMIAALLPFEMMAEWIPLNNKNATATPPKVSLISDDNSSTILKIELSGFEAKNFVTSGKTYQKLDLLTDVFSTQAGFPELPVVSKILAIPDLASVSVEVIETGDIQTFSNMYVQPARESWYEGQPETPYEENQSAYASNEVFPTQFVKTDPPSIFRDFRIARVSVYPMRYIPAKHEIQVASSITIRVNYGHDEAVNPKTSPRKKIAPSFAKLYRSFIFNYQEVLDNLYGGEEDGQELMLCIMPDDFTESFQVYADWKRQSGTDIHVTKFSDIGANATNPDIIKGHIFDAYNNWEVCPTYVLIVGDDGVFPKKIVTYPDYSFPDEDYFVELEGNDFFPEMMIGRFTNQGDYRMQVMINKFILYEKYPYTTDTDWFKKAICCSNNNYASQVATKRFTAGVMLEDGAFTSVDTLMSDGTGWGYNCSMGLNDVIGAINEGRSYLNYRGEGWYSGWSATCYDFSASDVNGLNNGQKFTFVTSIGCGVAGFQSSGGNCFGEAWVQLGSLTNPRGACAFIGPVSNTHTTYNNRIDKGIYVGMFQEGMDTPGQALLRGKLYMYNVFGPDYYTEYHYKIYCVLGDPSIHIWKDVPRAVNVDHPSTINVGNNSLEFTVTFAATGMPIANAELCLLGDDIYTTCLTDSTGKANINITTYSPETLTATVRGGNVVPYQGNISILQPQELVEPDGEPELVDLDGNIDGLINPNENGMITFTLKNWGTLAANNVEATLTAQNTNDVNIITTDPISYGNLAPGNTFTGSPFQFFVNPGCSVGSSITLQLHVTSSTTTWDYDFTTQIHGCQLDYKNFVVFDIGEPNMNYRMEPGETVLLVLSVENMGDDIAPDVMGILKTTDPYITINDSIGSFGTLGISALAMNMANYFELSVSPSCPTDYLAAFTMKLYTQNGNYPYITVPNFNLPVGLPIPTDYSGPDEYGYYAYSSNDAFYEQTPNYNWVEINEVGTQMGVPGISNFTQTITLPFPFKYYGIDYAQLRISTDGWIAFGSGIQTAPTNYELPYYDNVSAMAGVFWDDLYDGSFEEGKILYYNDNANHRFIVEWDSIAHNDTASEPQNEVFQAILLDPAYHITATGDGEIIFQYKDLKQIESNTVGIENPAQDIGLQYVFNTDYDATASTLVNNLAIKFTTQPPFLVIPVAVDEKNGNPDLANDHLLLQNYPNPFYTSTSISYYVPVSGEVILEVYNIRGELVRTLQNGQQQTGHYTVEWNGRNDNGNRVSTGVYFYRIQSTDFVETMKLSKLK